MSVGNFVLVILVVLIIYVIYLGIKIVPQSKVFVIERFGKFTRILDSGLSIIVPFVDNVAHRVDIELRTLILQFKILRFQLFVQQQVN